MATNWRTITIEDAKSAVKLYNNGNCMRREIVYIGTDVPVFVRPLWIEFVNSVSGRSSPASPKENLAATSCPMGVCAAGHNNKTKPRA